MTGLLIDGDLVDVPGVTVIPPASHGGPAWCGLDPGDYMARRLPISILTPHTTGGRWPQPIIEEPRPGGHAKEILDMWSGRDGGDGKSRHSGAALATDHDGVVYCAVDVARVATYNATSINARCIGIETCTYPDGSVTRAALRSTAAVIHALATRLRLPHFYPRGPYRGAPLRRLEVGGAGLYGCVGHREQTSQRGRGDPGDAIYGELAALGWIGVDYDGYEDQLIARRWQRWLNAEHTRLGLTWAPLVVDGVLGPASQAAMRRVGGSWAAVDRAISAA